MSNNPYQSPENAGSPAVRKKGGLKRYFLTALLLLVVAVIVVALLLPSVRSAPRAAQRAACSSQLKNIALALRAYEQEFHALPPAHTVDATGKPLHSWRTLILPYLEQKALYDQIDLTKPWNDPVNKVAYETRLGIYHCPSATPFDGQTTYLAVVGPQASFPGTVPRKLADITDDPSLTIMVIEVGMDSAVHWMAPVDVDEQHILNPHTFTSSPHLGLFHVACADGSVSNLSCDTQPERLRALMTIAGHDDDLAR